MSKDTRSNNDLTKEKERLREMLEAREAELSVLNSIQKALSAGEDIDSIFEIAGEQISQVFPGEGVALYTYHPETNAGEAKYILEDGVRHFPPPFTAGPIGQKAAKSKQTLVINSRKEFEELGAITIEGTKPSLSGVYAPLIVNDKPVGALNIESTKQEHAFGNADVQLVNTIARSLSIALENARLFNEAQRLLEETEARNAELAIINIVQSALASKLDMQAIFNVVGDKLQEVFPDAQVVDILDYDPATQLFHPRYVIERGKRYEVDSWPARGFRKHVVETGEPLVINTDMDAMAKKYDNEWVVLGEFAKSWVGVPMIIAGEPRGVISLQHIDKENAFSDSDVRLIQTLANSMSVALENARLFDETQRLLVETESRNAELAIINTVQQALASELDIQGIYDAVGEKLRTIFDSQIVAIYSTAIETRIQTCVYAFEKGRKLEVVSQPLSSLHDYLLEVNDTMVFNSNFPEFAAQFEDYSVSQGEMPRSVVAVPVPRMKDPDTFVTLTLQDVDGEKEFTDLDVRLLETLASSMGVALENARLFDDVQRSNRELSETLEQQSATSEILHVMVMSQDEVQPVLEAVAGNAARLCEADDVQIYKVDGDRLRQVAHFGPLPALGDGESLPLVKGLITGRAILEKRTIHTHDSAQISQDEYPESWELQKRLKHRSVIVTPLLQEGQASGAIVVRRNQVKPFSERQIALLATFADQAAIAIENVRLFNETQRLLKESEQRAAELQIINSVQEGLASKLEMQAIYDLIGEKIQEIFDADTTFIAFHDRDQDLIFSPYYNDRGAQQSSVTRKFGTGLAERVILSGEPLILDTAEDMRAVGSYEIASPGSDKDLNESFLGVPIYREGNPIGVTSVQSYKQHAYTQNDLTLLQTLTNSMSVALENARLFDETERLLKETEQRAAELATINTVGQALVAEPDLDGLIELIGEQMRRIFKADIVYVAMLDSESNIIRFPYTYGEEFEPLKLGDGLTSKVIESGEPLLINTDMEQRRQDLGVTRVGKRAASYLGVPIQVAGGTIGVISIQSIDDEEAFCENDMRLLNTIAANVSAAIRNAQLFEEVTHQKQYYEAVIENSPAAIVLLDLEAKVTGWNPAAERLFGYSEDEALGRNIDDLVAIRDELHAEAVRYSQEALRKKKVNLLARRTRKDGSLVEVDISGLPVKVAGEDVGLIAIYHDVTELQRARLAAEEANRAKSTFLANMSHELRTPLNAIIGFTRIVRRKSAEALPEKQRDNLDKVLVSAEHLLSLINTVLDISKIEAGRLDVKVEEFGLDTLVQEVVDSSQPLLKEGVQLRAEVDVEITELRTDQDKLRQIFINLLSNAAKFTHEGEIVMSAWQEGECLLVDVCDTGIGIPAGATDRVFEEFQQADTSTTRQYGGTGLGLSISRSLARLLGGDLTVASAEGQGSTFTLSIPLSYSDPQAQDGDEPVGAREVAIDTEKPVILSIDDDPNVHDMLEENLGEHGYRVVGVCSGEEGLRLAKTLMPMAITLDIMMPHKDGWQVLHDLKSDPDTRHIPVVLVSIVDEQSLGYKLGAADYLVKPLEEDALLSALGRIRAERDGKNVRVLVVDDDVNIPALIRQILDTEQYTVVSASDGKQALEMIQDESPDVLLLDLMMPRMDGFTLIEKLDNAGLEIPVIVITAKDLTGDEVEFLEGSVEKIIIKNGLDSKKLMIELERTMAKYLPGEDPVTVTKEPRA
jgi:PAS domain S-box-containing protein